MSRALPRPPRALACTSLRTSCGTVPIRFPRRLPVAGRKSDSRPNSAHEGWRQYDVVHVEDIRARGAGNARPRGLPMLRSDGATPPLRPVHGACGSARVCALSARRRPLGRDHQHAQPGSEPGQRLAGDARLHRALVRAPCRHRTDDRSRGSHRGDRTRQSPHHTRSRGPGRLVWRRIRARAARCRASRRASAAREHSHGRLSACGPAHGVCRAHRQSARGHLL